MVRRAWFLRLRRRKTYGKRIRLLPNDNLLVIKLRMIYQVGPYQTKDEYEFEHLKLLDKWNKEVSRMYFHEMSRPDRCINAYQNPDGSWRHNGKTKARA